MAVVAYTIRKSRQWSVWEADSRYPDDIVWRYAISTLSKRRKLPSESDSKFTNCCRRSNHFVDHDTEALGFLFLRTEFVPFVLRPSSQHYRNNRYWYFPRKRDCSALEFNFAHFDFEQYLSIASSRLHEKLLRIPLSTWLVLELGVIIVCLPSFATPTVQLIVFEALGYLILLSAAVVRNYLYNCYVVTIHGSDAWKRLDLQLLAAENDPDKLKDPQQQFQLICELMTVMMQRTGHALLNPLRAESSPSHRNRWKRCCALAGFCFRIRHREQPPEQSVRHLPNLSLSTVRILLVLIAVYTSLLIASVATYGLTSGIDTPGFLILATVVGILPIPVTVLLLSTALRYNTLLSVTGEHRANGVIADVVAAGKARMERSALRVLDALILKQHRVRASTTMLANHTNARSGDSKPPTPLLRGNQRWTVAFNRLSKPVNRNNFSTPAFATDGQQNMAMAMVVHWQEFEAWYRRWMLRADIPVSGLQIYNHVVCSTAKQYPPCRPANVRGIMCKLSEAEFSQLCSRHEQIERELRTDVQATEKALLDLYFPPKASTGTSSSSSSSTDTPTSATADEADTTAIADSGRNTWIRKEAFLSTLFATLGWGEADDSATPDNLHVRAELVSFFDEVDETLEGLVRVSSLANVLLRYLSVVDRTEQNLFSTNRSEQTV